MMKNGKSGMKKYVLHQLVIVIEQGVKRKTSNVTVID